MKLRSRLTHLPLACLILSLSAPMLGGCSDDGLGKRYKVSGKVTYKGAPLEKGLISFIASNPDGRSATGMIEKGYYTLTTQEPGDGAFPGSYSVTITSKTPDFKLAGEKAQAKGNTSAYIPQDFTAEANKKAPNAIPDKFAVIGPTNPLKGEVKSQSNTLDFDLVD